MSIEKNRSSEIFKPSELKEIKPKKPMKDSLVISPKQNEVTQKTETEASPKLAAPSTLGELKPVKGSLLNRLQQQNEADDAKISPRRMLASQESIGIASKETVSGQPRSKLLMMSSPKPTRHPEHVIRTKQQISASDQKKVTSLI